MSVLTIQEKNIAINDTKILNDSMNGKSILVINCIYFSLYCTNWYKNVHLKFVVFSSSY